MVIKSSRQFVAASVLCAIVPCSPCIAQVQVQAQARDHVVLGAGVAATPVYQGAADYRVLPIPLIDIQKGAFFASLRNGIGLAPVDTGTVRIGVGAVYVQGYRRRDVPAGIDRVSDGVGLRTFAEIRTWGFVGTMGAVKGLAGGTKGMIADAGLSYPIALTRQLRLVPMVATTWANAKHNDGYFGIDPSEAVRSGLSAFHGGAGFKDVSAGLTITYRLNDRMTLSATGSATRLLETVGDSPLVRKKARPTGLLGVSYRL